MNLHATIKRKPLINAHSSMPICRYMEHFFYL